MKRVLGLDIGGANLKMAHTDGTARTVPFELWKQPGKLSRKLRALLAAAPLFDELAVTMTGELCDCFATKRDGVHAILDAVLNAARSIPARIWCTAGGFVDLPQAREQPLQIASANWLALATFVGRYARQGPAMLVDIGSTTADLIPLLDGVPQPRGRTDVERLKTGELAYKGARRTPACAILPGGRFAMEFFATIHDIYLVMGQAAENSDDCDTADGRPATRAFALARLARMLGGDAETVPEDKVTEFAALAEINHILQIMAMLFEAASALPVPPRRVVLAGSGEFVGRRVLHWIRRYSEESLRRMLPQHWPPALVRPRIVSLAGRLGEALSISACAYAVAVLTAEGAHGP